MILIPNILTALSLFMGLFSILFIIKGGSVFTACWIVFGCAFLDGLDGPLARLLNASTLFGRYFDSAADFVAFGLAPVFIAWALEPSKHLFLTAASLIYLCSCVFRLVRFHLLCPPGNQPSRFFTGLPITASACLFAALILVFGEHLSVWSVAGAQFLLSVLMVSRIQVKRLIF